MITTAVFIILNLILIYFLKRKEIKKIIFKKKIKQVNITEIDEVFKPNQIKEVLFPTENYVTKFFFVPSELNIVGMTSDLEGWILSMLAKKSKMIFEFGTCSGKTTYLMALNSDKNSKIYTVTLNPSDIENINKKNGDSKIAQKNIINETIYDKFLFSGEPEEKKIKVFFMNSLIFDESNFLDKMDLIFIDGGHTFSVIKNDSEKAFKMIRSKGVILWHDYNPGKNSSKDVVRYLNSISKDKQIFKIKNTSLCFYQKN